MRFDRTRERLERWAAWLEGKGQVRSARLDGMPHTSGAGGKVPTSYREQIETHEIVRSLDVEYQLALGRFYIDAPRHHKKTMREIAEYLSISERTLYRYMDEAESKFNEALDIKREKEDKKRNLKNRS